ncbi:MAG: hypothetical protein GY717_08700 [Rhodobacteraceae bacterium]|nr:hypothetical protein [Paracoccaceae bacterium]
MSQRQQEMEKRGAKLTRKEQLAQELRGMMAYGPAHIAGTKARAPIKKAPLT